MRNLIFLLILFSFGQCHSQRNFFGYDLSKPSKFVKLPKTLNEISGLAYLNRRNLLSVQDEKGTIYQISTHSGKIKKERNFGKKGDYEGICLIDKTIYVLRSDGTLFQVKGNKSKKYEFKHHKNMDFEGLCYDEDHNRLLVACKENLHKGSKKEIFIYAFDLKNKKYKKKPFLHIKKKDVHKNFKPSGITVHPNGTIYILSSFSKSLLVISPEGSILDKTQLNEYIFHQPEGIAFDKKGRLFISNEKHKTYPTLLRFDPK